MSKEAMKLALEGAANYIDALGGDSRKYRQALANEALDKMAENARELGLDYEPAQQEPVAYRVKWPAIGGGYKWLMVDKPLMEKEGFANEALYTSPQAQRTWVGLTDEEVKECFESVPTQDCQNYEHWRSLCARNIETKLREKNT